MERTYRVETIRNGKRSFFGCFHSTPSKIRTALEGHLVNHPVVEVFFKTGKIIKDSFRG